MFQVEVFWVVTPCSVVAGYQNSRRLGSLDLWNVDILPQHYTASQSTRPRLGSKCTEQIWSWGWIRRISDSLYSNSNPNWVINLSYPCLMFAPPSSERNFESTQIITFLTAYSSWTRHKISQVSYRNEACLVLFCLVA